jgi:hypothetical protein
MERHPLENALVSPCLACFCVSGHGIFPPRCPESPSVISETSTISETTLPGWEAIAMRVWDVGMGTPRPYPSWERSPCSPCGRALASVYGDHDGR